MQDRFRSARNAFAVVTPALLGATFSLAASAATLSVEGGEPVTALLAHVERLDSIALEEQARGWKLLLQSDEARGELTTVNEMLTTIAGVAPSSMSPARRTLLIESARRMRLLYEELLRPIPAKRTLETIEALRQEGLLALRRLEALRDHGQP